MRLISLDLTAFRNIAAAHLRPGPYLNLVIGANGQGKTNLVEAIAFLSWLRSFRTSRSADLVARGAARALLRAQIEGPQGRHEVSVEVGPGFRKVAVDGHPVRSARECLAHVTVVFLSPDDHAVLEGGPEGRRTLLDRTLVLLDPSLSGTLLHYQHLLKERNALLRQDPASGSDPDVMDACEAALAEAGAQIVRARVSALDRLVPVLDERLRVLTGQDLRPSIRYISRWGVGQDATDPVTLRQILRERRVADGLLGYTTVGPHTDDVQIEVRGLPARGHASRGQRKVLLLSWKAAETSLFEADRADTPILILDDALADLDPERQERLLVWLSAYRGQSFVTATSAPDLGGTRTVRVRAEDGTFSPVSSEGVIR